ncbi:DUF1573 domain-containing protein [bacterium]|nr:DUF1573 domain-containing protein [bacterium]
MNKLWIRCRLLTVALGILGIAILWLKYANETMVFHVTDSKDKIILEYDMNLGTVYNDRIYEKKFTISNESHTTVTMEVLQRSCGCTSVHMPNDSISPLSDGIIYLRFDPTNREGFQKQRVVMGLNGGNIKRIDFDVTANIIKVINYSPKIVTFSEFGNKLSQKVNVNLKNDVVFNITDISLPNTFNISCHPGDILKGDNIIEISIKKNHELKKGGDIKIFGKEKGQQIIIPVIFDKQKYFSVEPAILHIFCQPNVITQHEMIIQPKFHLPKLDNAKIDSSLENISISTNLTNNNNESYIQLKIITNPTGIIDYATGSINIKFKDKQQSIPVLISIFNN